MFPYYRQVRASVYRPLNWRFMFVVVAEVLHLVVVYVMEEGEVVHEMEL